MIILKKGLTMEKYTDNCDDNMSEEEYEDCINDCLEDSDCIVDVFDLFEDD